MSWVEGLKKIEFLGFKHASVEISKKDLHNWGCCFPLMINHKQLAESILGVDGLKLSDIIGKGNAEDYDYMMADFHILSTIVPNWFEEYDDKLLSYNESEPLSMLISWGVLKTEVLNSFTNEVVTRNNIITLVNMPQYDDLKLQYYLGGFYSPVQDLLVSNFDMINRDTLFHESIHAIKRSVEDNLRFLMYGGESQQEEIMTHLFTDKFNQFSGLNKFIKDNVIVTEKSIGKWKSPTDITINAALTTLSGTGSVASQAKSVIGGKAFKFSDVMRSDISASGLNSLKALRSKKLSVNVNQKDLNKQTSAKDVVRKEFKDLLKSTGLFGKSFALASKYLEE